MHIVINYMCLCIDQQLYRVLGQSPPINWTSMQKFVTEISCFELFKPNISSYVQYKNIFEVCRCFSWSETTPMYWQSARWCKLCYTRMSLVILLFAVKTSTLWCWECRQCFLKVSGHSEHQYVFDFRCDVFAYYVLRITYLRIVQLWWQGISLCVGMWGLDVWALSLLMAAWALSNAIRTIPRTGQCTYEGVFSSSHKRFWCRLMVTQSMRMRITVSMCITIW